jgi:hypothetical protein
MAVKIATIQRGGADGGDVTLTGTQLALITAVIGIVPALVSAGVTYLGQPKAEDFSLRDRDMKVKERDMQVKETDAELRRTQADAEWVRLALAQKDAADRKRALEFLLAARLVREDIRQALTSEVPHLLAPAPQRQQQQGTASDAAAAK